MDIEYIDFGEASVRELVVDIAVRFTELTNKLDLPNVKPLQVMLDLGCCHATHPLDLERMLHGRDEDLVHDIVGIRKHLDRDNGGLTDGFSPRFTMIPPLTE